MVEVSWMGPDAQGSVYCWSIKTVDESIDVM
jgi:hypothetical protein